MQTLELRLQHNLNSSRKSVAGNILSQKYDSKQTEVHKMDLPSLMKKGFYSYVGISLEILVLFSWPV